MAALPLTAAMMALHPRAARRSPLYRETSADVYAMGTLHLIAYTVALGSLIARVALSDFVDDAWITFIYARNIAEGRGFIYSDLYPTWGTTTPGFTLLMALAARIGLDIPLAARLVDFAALVGQAVCLVALARLMRIQAYASSIVLLWSITWWLPGSFPGMEYGLFTALSLGAITSVAWRRFLLAAALAGLAAVVRPDGLWPMLLVACAYAFHTRLRDRPVAFALILLGPLTVWSLYALATFGSVLPRTLEVRQVEAGTWGSFLPFIRLYYLDPSTATFHLVPMLAGGLLAAWKFPPMRWVILYGVGHVAMYNVKGLPGLPQYLCPINTLAPLLTLALPALVMRLRPARDAALWLLLLCSTLGCGWRAYYISYYIWRMEFRTESHLAKWEGYEAAIRWMEDHTPAEWTFATNEIGYLGWRTNRTILEIGSLVNPEGLPYMRTGDLPGLMRSFDAPLLILPRVTESLYFSEGLDNSRYALLGEIASWDYGGVGVYVRRDLMDEPTIDDHRELLKAHARNVLREHRGQLHAPLP